jgi:hypothetical protein
LHGGDAHRAVDDLGACLEGLGRRSTRTHDAGG